MQLKVGVPFAKHGRITDATLRSLKALAQDPDLDVEIVTQQGSNVPRARNAMINGERSHLKRQKLDGFDWFLCVDADTGFTPDHVKRLLAHDKDVVSGTYLHKHDASRVVAGWFGDVDGLSPMDKRVTPDRTGLFEVDWVGAGFLLMRRGVFERVPYPWFACTEVEYDSPQGVCAQTTSDDLGLCMKLKANGETVWLDADCRVDHVPHPNEHNPAGSLQDALNDLLRNREVIIRHIKGLADENRRLKTALAADEDG